MNNHTGYAKKIGIKELIIERSQLSNSHRFDANSGKINSSFGFVKKGSVILNSMGNQINIPAGSLFYIPDGARYNSVWSGGPDIEYYSIHMILGKYDSLSSENYSIQHVPEFSNPETEKLFDKIYTLFSTENHIDALKALGLYYDFYASVIPYLKPATSITRNPALISALEYIENNFSKNFGIDELAAFCCISESRLHHLFQSELKTTPIKYRNQLRVENAASDLLHSDYSLEKIAEINGFHSTTYFREIFKQNMGVSPAKYRKQGIIKQG